MSAHRSLYVSHTYCMHLTLNACILNSMHLPYTHSMYLTLNACISHTFHVSHTHFRYLTLSACSITLYSSYTHCTRHTLIACNAYALNASCTHTHTACNIQTVWIRDSKVGSPFKNCGHKDNRIVFYIFYTHIFADANICAETIVIDS